jgi:hypothetical protein
MKSHHYITAGAFLSCLPDHLFKEYEGKLNSPHQKGEELSLSELHQDINKFISSVNLYYNQIDKDADLDFRREIYKLVRDIIEDDYDVICLKLEVVLRLMKTYLYS